MVYQRLEALPHYAVREREDPSLAVAVRLVVGDLFIKLPTLALHVVNRQPIIAVKFQNRIKRWKNGLQQFSLSVMRRRDGGQELNQVERQEHYCPRYRGVFWV